MNADLTDLYQEVILEHAKSPRNFGAMPNAKRSCIALVHKQGKLQP